MPAALLPWMLTLKEEGPIGLFGLRWLESVDNRQLKHPKRLKEATSIPTMSPTALPTALHRQRLLPANIHRPKQLFIDSSRTFHRHHHRHKSACSPILHQTMLPQHTFLSRLLSSTSCSNKRLKRTCLPLFDGVLFCHPPPTPWRASVCWGILALFYGPTVSQTEITSKSRRHLQRK